MGPVSADDRPNAVVTTIRGRNHRSMGMRSSDPPRRNAKDVTERPAVVREGMELVQVESLDEVLAVALLPLAPADEPARSLQVA